MIPILFGIEAVDFTTNGLGRLSECVSCVVTEERNGIYELELVYPITGRFYKTMLGGGIIGAIHDDSGDIQPFDIYGYSAPIDGFVTFYAHHVSYRLNRVIVKPFTAGSPAEAFVKIKNNSANANVFTFWTDKATTGEMNVTVPAVAKSLLGGSEGSVLDVFGKGDYQFDNWTVRLYADRGRATDVTIRYGKNLVDLTKDKDTSETYTAVAPYWQKEDQTVTLSDVIVVASGAPLTLRPWTDSYGNEITDGDGNVIEFRSRQVEPIPLDLSTEFEDPPTQTQLRQAAMDYLARNEGWVPDENIEVDFVQLWQTPEYENVAALQRVALCDTVSVYYPELGVTAENQKVIKVVYNVLLERFDSMELGRAKTSLAQTIQQAVNRELEDVPDVSFMQRAIEAATSLITGGLGGFVVFNFNADGQPQELLIMDTPDINTAVNVIRMNRNGIGFSHTGYEGPFVSAWTIDGTFNADFINAGTISANLIYGGLLSDVAGTNFWNLLSGDLQLTGDLRSVANNAEMLISTIDVPTPYVDNATGAVTINTTTCPAIVIKTTADGKSAARYFALDTSWRYDKALDYSEYSVLNSSIRGFGAGEVETKVVHMSDDKTYYHFEAFGDGHAEYCVDEEDNVQYGFYMDATSFQFLSKSLRSADNYINFNTYGAPSFDVYINNGTNSTHLEVRPNGVYVNGQKVQVQSSSSRRYKHDIAPLSEDLDPHKLLKLPVRQFIYNDDAKLQYPDMAGQTLPGIIAEDVEEFYPAAVIHDIDGEAESWDERRLIPGMLALIQEQQKRIDDLEARLEKLERMVLNDN